MTSILHPDIPVERADPSIPLPTRATPDAAGYDVCAYLPDGAVELPGGTRMLVRTGLRMAIPHGWELQVRPRSGLALKHGVTVLNTPGTLDSDYRGEVGVILINTEPESFVVEPGMRIAQLVLAPVYTAVFHDGVVDYDTTRGAGGFGSTGTK